MKSIVSNERECYLCRKTQDLHKHHIFYGRGKNREYSEKYGCWIYLCKEHHNWSNEGIHFNRSFDEKIKRECQEIFEKQYSHEKFMELFKKNYI